MASIKHALRRSIGLSLLTLSSYQTICIEIEEMLNSRPLTIVSDDPSNGIPLTPNHFLKLQGQESIPSFPTSTDVAQKLRHSFELRNQLLQAFWKRWTAEYLQQIHLWRQSKKIGSFLPSVGDLVLIKEEAPSRLHWPKGIVEKVLAGRDGHSRVCWVRIIKRNSSGEILHTVIRRSTRLLYPLELADQIIQGPSVMDDVAAVPTASDQEMSQLDESTGSDAASSASSDVVEDVLVDSSDPVLVDSTDSSDVFVPAQQSETSTTSHRRPRKLPLKFRDFVVYS